MAQQWYIQRCGDESGPIAFRELVELVRTGVVNEGDLVRSSWKTDWQTAESVVGLFHMAGRTIEELEQHFAPPPAPTPIAEPAAEETEEIAERPGWLKRLFEVDGRPGTSAKGEIPILGPPPSAVMPPEDTVVAGTSPAADGSPTEVRKEVTSPQSRGESLVPELAAYASPLPGGGNAWSEAIDSAVAAADSRRAMRSGGAGRLSRLWASLRSSLPQGEQGTGLLRWGLRIVPAIVCANLVALAVENWSTQEALRFPPRAATATRHAAMRQFPLVGACGQGEYLFLLFDLTLASGAATYFAARWLESRAE